MSLMGPIPMQFVEMDGGCFVCVSHRLNPDGYLRKSWGSSRRPEERSIEMFHRFIFRAHNDLETIPDGYEVDHLCFNRACCAPSHLRLLDTTTHRVETNKTRWLRKAAPVS
jgi:hypothetical protein